MRRTKPHAEGHENLERWLLTYADMITLLLCFFAIFLFISIPRKDVPQKAEIALPMPLPVDLIVVPASFTSTPMKLPDVGVP